MDTNYNNLEVIIKEKSELSFDSDSSQSPIIVTDYEESNYALEFSEISKKCGEIHLQELETFVIVCSYCSTMYSNYEDFILHIRTQHEEMLNMSQFYNKTDNLDFKTKQIQEDELVIQTNQINNETDEDIDNKNTIDFVDTKDIESIILTPNHEIKVDSLNIEQKPIREKKKRIRCFPCDICCIKFRTKKALNEHQTQNHTQEGVKDEKNEISKSNKKRKRIFPCEVCSMVFKTKRNLNEHREIEHQVVKNLNSEHDTDKKLELTEDKSNTSYDIKNSLPKSFQCTFCDKMFRKKEYLQRHSLFHKSFEEHPYKCESCNKIFSEKIYLKAHIRWHNNDPFPCRICGKEFFMDKSRKYHELIHGEKKLLCTICGKTFVSASCLRDHTMRHKGIKPHKCEYCTMSFASSNELVEHRRKHTGEKPHKCDICGGRFALSCSLRMHKKLHSDAAQYKCKICGKSFKQNAGLYMHKKTHCIEN